MKRRSSARPFLRFTVFRAEYSHLVKVRGRVGVRVRVRVGVSGQGEG